MLQILVALRNQLQEHADRDGKHLTFPRFDLGAAIALAAPAAETMALISRRDVIRQITESHLPVSALQELSGDLNSIAPPIAVALAALKWATRSSHIGKFLLRLALISGWQWYRDHTTDIGLRSAKTKWNLLLRLYAMSRPDQPERLALIEEILPAAFVADLYASLVATETPKAWDQSTNVILFLDGFETLLAEPGNRALLLLESLALTQHREQGKTDPLLVVIGSRQRLLDVTEVDHNPPLKTMNPPIDNATAQQQAQERLERWQQHLPTNRRFLRLADLYFPFWLQDFGREDTHAYLASLDRHHQSYVFKDSTLVESLHQKTHGHPLYLALAAATIFEAIARGRPLPLQAIEHAPVTRHLAPGYEDEQIGNYLLDLFLRQLSEVEQRQLILCAAPRALDVSTLQIALQHSSSVEAQERWEHYRSLTFFRASSKEQLALHPIVRALLLQKLPPSRNPESDYYQVHTRLRAHFIRHASMSETERDKEQAQIEEAYHALALGDPAPAIGLVLASQRNQFTSWNELMEAVSQAPTALIPPETEQQAAASLEAARQQLDMRQTAFSLILNRWLLSSSNVDPQKIADRQHQLSVAYATLPGRNRQANLEQAIAYCKQALTASTPESFPVEWARLQGNLGTLYSQLPQGDPLSNFNNAIACHKAALRIYTRETYPNEWATAKNQLGAAYTSFPGGERQANLDQAIRCFQDALEIRTREKFPEAWAGTQNNLGLAYSELSGGHNPSDLHAAIRCFKRVLTIFTREAFPRRWADTMTNLGKAHIQFLGQEHQAHLEIGVKCLEAALEEHTPETAPVTWATIHYNLGIACGQLLQGGNQQYGERAIQHFQDALLVHTREAFPLDWARAKTNMGSVYGDLTSGDRRKHLQLAIQCYQEALEIYNIMPINQYIQVTRNNLLKVQAELQNLVTD